MHSKVKYYYHNKYKSWDYRLRVVRQSFVVDNGTMIGICVWNTYGEGSIVQVSTHRINNKYSQWFQGAV
jgi:tRNA A37 threonylcarbamoyltransferase TsaD